MRERERKKRKKKSLIRYTYVHGPKSGHVRTGRNIYIGKKITSRSTRGKANENERKATGRCEKGGEEVNWVVFPLIFLKKETKLGKFLFFIYKLFTL